MTTATHIERAVITSRRRPRDILARLQLETAREHSAIEAATGVMNPELELADYRVYLERMLGFYVPVEAALADLGAWQELELEPRSKLSFLQRDIVSLGGQAASVAICDAPPDLQTLAQAVGCAYVLEGSTLGGRVIARHLIGRLGSDVPRGFLECYGENTGRYWQAFRAGLSRFSSSRDRQREVVVGAKKTFRRLTSWLNRA